MKTVTSDFSEFFGEDKISSFKHFKFTELEKKLYESLTKEFEEFVSKIEKKLEDKLTIKMINSDDSDLSLEIKFEGPEQTVEKGEKSFIKKLEKYKENLAKEIDFEREYETVDIKEVNKKKEKLEGELIKIHKLNKKDKIRFPDTWTWDNMDEEGIKNF